MDVLFGVSGLGLYISNKEEPPEDIPKIKRIQRDRINGNNIYDSVNYRLNKRLIDNIAFERYELAKDPMKSGIIPNFYNQLKEVVKRSKAEHDEFLKDYNSHEVNLKDREMAEGQGIAIENFTNGSEKPNNIKFLFILTGILIFLILIVSTILTK